jgi:hypothetical protein
MKKAPCGAFATLLRRTEQGCETQGLCVVVAGTGVALFGLVEAAAAVVAPIEIAAGTSSGPMAAPPTVAVVAAAAPAAWPPAAAPAAGAWAMVVDAAGAAGTAVCALATLVAAIAVKRRASLMPESPELVLQ